MGTVSFESFKDRITLSDKLLHIYNIRMDSGSRRENDVQG